MIRELHEKLKNQKITAVKLTQDYFEKIKKTDPKIQAFLTLTEDLALKEAKLVDKKIKRGEEIDLLAGIPGAIKDNICRITSYNVCYTKLLRLTLQFACRYH